jgi:SAM-dependent methyltransferase
MSSSNLCPLCQSDSSFFHKTARYNYLQCKQCELIFIPPESLPSREEEKAQYDLHKNNPDDIGYRNFLNRLTEPLLERLAPKSSGLDFGCGPGPTLSVILEEAGHKMSIYDPIYHPNDQLLNESYDFITATEVFEHLHKPTNDLKILYSTLKKNGWLGIMTKRALGKESFARWHYTHDPTHVCFWSETTFNWLASQWQTVAEFPAADVVLLQKK